MSDSLFSDISTYADPVAMDGDRFVLNNDHLKIIRSAANWHYINAQESNILDPVIEHAADCESSYSQMLSSQAIRFLNVALIGLWGSMNNLRSVYYKKHHRFPLDTITLDNGIVIDSYEVMLDSLRSLTHEIARIVNVR